MPCSVISLLILLSRAPANDLKYGPGSVKGDSAEYGPQCVNVELGGDAPGTVAAAAAAAAGNGDGGGLECEEVLTTVESTEEVVEERGGLKVHAIAAAVAAAAFDEGQGGDRQKEASALQAPHSGAPAGAGAGAASADPRAVAEGADLSGSGDAGSPLCNVCAALALSSRGPQGRNQQEGGEDYGAACEEAFSGQGPTEGIWLHAVQYRLLAVGSTFAVPSPAWAQLEKDAGLTPAQLSAHTWPALGPKSY